MMPKKQKPILCTVRCQTHDAELGSGLYEPDKYGATDHKTAGIAAGLAAAHKAVFPHHKITFSREGDDA